MVGTTVLQQNHFSTPQVDQSKCHSLDFDSKEQGCISLMKKCKNMQEFKQIHTQVMKMGLFWSSFCTSNLLTTCALSEWGSMDYACSIFQHIDNPGSFEFNTMIRGHVNSINLDESLSMYLDMLEEGVLPDNFTYPPLLKACSRLSMIEGVQIHGHIFKLGLQEDVFVQNSLINMYGKHNETKNSCLVFNQMDQKTSASWSALISAHVNSGMWSECFTILQEMNNQGQCRPEESILASLLTSCTRINSLNSGKSIHGYLLRNLSGFNVIIETSLIDMYVKCGFLEKGLSLFQTLEKKNETSYSVIISGLASHGRGEEALKVFKTMLDEGFKPDDIVYVSVLSSYTCVKEGLNFFDRMRFEYKVEPTIQHYGCIIDLLSRSGMINEAFKMIESMPTEPNDVIWRSVLSSSSIHRDIESSEISFKKLKKLIASDYLVMSNMYAQAQRWEDMAQIRTKMNDEHVTQTPGSSTVYLNGNVYKFVSQEKSYPKCDGVYKMLYQMKWQLKFEGYKEEKSNHTNTHSQKLAIAFALIHTSQSSSIRIVRNVRMCSDCHTYTKFISTIYEREIIVKDRNRFHHFKDGICSCKDYW